jgi:hypothetical protein
MLEVQEKARFIANVFLTPAHRPEEFRTFLICCPNRRAASPDDRKS